MTVALKISQYLDGVVTTYERSLKSQCSGSISRRYVTKVLSSVTCLLEIQEVSFTLANLCSQFIKKVLLAELRFELGSLDSQPNAQGCQSGPKSVGAKRGREFWGFLAPNEENQILYFSMNL